MRGDRIFVGRKGELARFAEVLEEPGGQAILVIGQTGMGKTWLVDEMGEAAYGELDLECGWVRYEVTPNDTPDSIMALMMDNAFDAAQVVEGSFEKTDRRRGQWKALLNVVKIGDLVESMRRDPARNTREQFLERLRLISERMPDSGRAIFVIDPEKYMRKDSDQDWAIVVRDLPDKVKFVFAQRPEDVLVASEVFGALENVVRIPEANLAELDKQAVGEFVHLRAGDVEYSEKELREGLERYEGYPYALGAALDLIMAGVKIEDLPEHPEPIRFAEVQWEKVCEISDEAVKLMEAYAVLEVGVAEDVVETVSGISATAKKRLEENRFLRGLLREEEGGKRIYHAILTDFILRKMKFAERREYVRRAVGIMLAKDEIRFFEKARLLDLVHSSEWACQKIADELHKAFEADEASACYFYERNEFSDEPSSQWAGFLKEAGEFEGLDRVGEEKQVPNVEWLRAKYLARAAAEAPEEVFSVISTVEPKNELIQSLLIEAIANMPDEWAERGYPIIKGWIGTRKPFAWYWAGEESAKLMCRLLDVNVDVAFKIAGLLLEVWHEKEAEKHVLSLRKIRARFEEYEYRELVLKYYEGFWKRYPYRAAMLLVNTFAKGLDETNEGQGGDVSEWLYGVENIENLDEPPRLEINYEAIIVEGICRAGKEMIQKEEESVEEFLQNLRSRQRAIFNRVEMYLLRFVMDAKYSERIGEIVGNRNYFDNARFKYEYALLLRDKKDLVSDDVKERYVKWVRDIKVDDLENFADWFRRTRKREYTQTELEGYESGMRARKLYLVREVFPDIYEECKNKAGATDEDLKPIPMVGEVRVISESESEGSPKTKEEMLEVSVEDVLEFVRDPENYKEPEDGGYRPHPVASALAYTLQQVIKERTVDYVRS